MKRKMGYVLLVAAVLCWVATPLLLFFKATAGAAVITVVVVAGEVFLVAAIALLGKEMWQKIKAGIAKMFGKKNPIL